MIFKQFTLFAVIMGIATGVFHHFQLLGVRPDFAWVCFVFFMLLTYLILYIAALSQKASTPVKGTYMILGAMGIKFLFSAMLILIYLMAVRPNDPKFILPFFVYYILFTVMETKYLLQITKGGE